jgi:hypothetical protein
VLGAGTDAVERQDRKSEIERIKIAAEPGKRDD